MPESELIGLERRLCWCIKLLIIQFQQENCSDCHFADPDNLGDVLYCTYQGKTETKRGNCLVKKPRVHCFTCGIYIGPFYIERWPFPVGDKVVCGYCSSILHNKGYITLDAYIKIEAARKLMPDGTITGKRTPS